MQNLSLIICSLQQNKSAKERERGRESFFFVWAFVWLHVSEWQPEQHLHIFAVVKQHTDGKFVHAPRLHRRYYPFPFQNFVCSLSLSLVFSVFRWIFKVVWGCCSLGKRCYCTRKNECKIKKDTNKTFIRSLFAIRSPLLSTYILYSEMRR